MTLLEAMNLEYSLSKRWLMTSLTLTSVLYVCLIATALVSGPWAKWIAFTAFIDQALITGARLRSGTHYSLGESVRRPAMLENGLGARLSPIQVAKIAAKHGVTFPGDPITSKNYYDSTAEAGPERLLEITQQSAFWTGELAERMASLLKGGLAVVFIVLMIAVLAALQTGITGTRGETLAKIGMATISVWCTGELFVLFRRYDLLARSIQRVLVDSELAMSRSWIGCESAVILGEYNCSLASAPVIPDFIYKLNRTRLNLAWAARNAQGTSRQEEH